MRTPRDVYQSRLGGLDKVLQYGCRNFQVIGPDSRLTSICYNTAEGGVYLSASPRRGHMYGGQRLEQQVERDAAANIPGGLK